ncbi:MAG: T9SS type A sorting domain-containing protein [candidate division Zixibacteria bacterium]|nr:T9SS type A sorting domain-containing protein [candidate division Zixibacteria bacterium]
MYRLIVSVLTVLLLSNTALAVDINWNQHNIVYNFIYAIGVYATDVDGDEDIDVLGAAALDHTISWFENNGSQTFTEHVIDANFTQAWRVHARDIDLDGDTDVLGAADWADEVSWWENNGNQVFGKHFIRQDLHGARRATAADIDADNDIDVICSSLYDDSVLIMLNDGNENFSEFVVDGDFFGAQGIDIVDMNEDGMADIVGAAGGADEVCWWEQTADFSFHKHIIDDSCNGARDIQSIDIDGDGDEDIVATGAWDDEVLWYENDGNYNFAKNILATGFNWAHDVHAADIDGDGDVDIAATSLEDGRLHWWDNDGQENFIMRDIAPNFAGSGGLYIIDLDLDGDEDVICTSRELNTIQWWENGLNPAIGVTVLPQNEPVTVNPGGTFKFTGMLVNNLDVAKYTDLWLMIKLPRGHLYGPIELYSSISLGAHQQILVSGIIQDIPSFAPPGTYEFVAFCGDYPTRDFFDISSFKFLVSGEPELNAVKEWNTGGWIDDHAAARATQRPKTLNSTARPNPFNARTTINFALEQPAEVNLTVYNILGQEVNTIIDSRYESGNHSVNWDASSYPSGIYFYRLTAGELTSTKKIVLMK